MFAKYSFIKECLFQIKMAEIAFVYVDSEPVKVKEECAEEVDPLTIVLPSTKGT